MTGYGRSSKNFEKRTITVELRAVNSKTTDLRLKLPLDFKDKEIILRKLITDKGERGKIDVQISIESNMDKDNSGINQSLFKRYYREIQKLNEELGNTGGNFTEAVLRIPNVVTGDTDGINDEEWEEIEQVVNEAFEQFNAFRLAEGKAHEDDLRERTNGILVNLLKISPFETDRINKMKQRLRQNLEEFWGRDNVDENRYEQEILFYVDKMDITEEKIRLEQHCKYFIDQLDNNLTSKGRQLNFITQEMGREINTLGAKAYHSEIQHLVVGMKDELEKIKEQIANVL
ncbi:MAG: YicC family protein [Saprospiraceae bacterium]|nr:YicC family protein [Saprospiraceae bacterium]